MLAKPCIQESNHAALTISISQVMTWLLSVPGASKTVLEARIPYGGGKSMAEILAKEPQTYACTLTAVDMARAAYRQAAHLSEFGVPILGVSCTCALATDRVKKGDHKARPFACFPPSRDFPCFPPRFHARPCTQSQSTEHQLPAWIAHQAAQSTGRPEELDFHCQTLGS